MKGAQSTSSCLQELSWRHPCVFQEFLSALGLTFAEFCFAMASDGAAPPTGTAEVTSLVLIFLRFVFANHKSRKCLLSLCWISSFHSLKLRHDAFCMDPDAWSKFHISFFPGMRHIVGQCCNVRPLQPEKLGNQGQSKSVPEGNARWFQRQCTQAKKGRDVNELN